MLMSMEDCICFIPSNVRGAELETVIGQVAATTRREAAKRSNEAVDGPVYKGLA